MNSLYNNALRQGAAIRKDLDALASGSESSSALLGQVNASLTSFSRTIDDYNKLAKQELVPEKQTKAYERVKTFKSELGDYRDRMDRLKNEASERQATQARTDLFARRPHHAATPENPYANAGPSSSNPFGATALGASPLDTNRETHAFREQNFMQDTHRQLDNFLDYGSDVLSNLGQQRETLKNAQRRLYSVGTTLGISGDTIRMVERRAKQHKWIFWGGVIIFFLFCYFVIKWLR
ncbi:synaptobrevin [Microthyrium microscopicum]|uniref:Protein transport protein BOS1 n=1 Tax=Microthyrium microscopicum TaxID=703497 RepID=A0A6A6U8S9_9PEZI|nr:synaptobrevin [Microthyrium microscopicum]